MAGVPKTLLGFVTIMVVACCPLSVLSQETNGNETDTVTDPSVIIEAPVTTTQTIEPTAAAATDVNVISQTVSSLMVEWVGTESQHYVVEYKVSGTEESAFMSANPSDRVTGSPLQYNITVSPSLTPGTAYDIRVVAYTTENSQTGVPSSPATGTTEHSSTSPVSILTSESEITMLASSTQGSTFAPLTTNNQGVSTEAKIMTTSHSDVEDTTTNDRVSSSNPTTTGVNSITAEQNQTTSSTPMLSATTDGAMIENVTNTLKVSDLSTTSRSSPSTTNQLPSMAQTTFDPSFSSTTLVLVTNSTPNSNSTFFNATAAESTTRSNTMTTTATSQFVTTTTATEDNATTAATEMTTTESATTTTKMMRKKYSLVLESTHLKLTPAKTLPLLKSNMTKSMISSANFCMQIRWNFGANPFWLGNNSDIKFSIYFTSQLHVLLYYYPAAHVNQQIIGERTAIRKTQLKSSSKQL